MHSQIMGNIFGDASGMKKLVMARFRRVPTVQEMLPSEAVSRCTSVTRYGYIPDTSLDARNGSPVFSTVLEASHVNKEDLWAAFRLTKEDDPNIRKLSKDARDELNHQIHRPANLWAQLDGVPKNINDRHISSCIGKEAIGYGADGVIQTVVTKTGSDKC
jgi:hypothetical protein